VECTGSYGAALSRHLRTEGVEVIEVNQPDKATRRRRGKTDALDAEAAARAVLAGTSAITPKSGDDWVEQLRILRVARRSAIQARTQTINQMYAVVVGAPADLRDQLHRLSRHQLIAQAARFRVAEVDDVRSVVRWTLRLLAQRHQALTAEIMQATYMASYPNAELEVMANAGHYPMNETPVALATSIEAFLRRE